MQHVIAQVRCPATVKSGVNLLLALKANAGHIARHHAHMGPLLHALEAVEWHTEPRLNAAFALFWPALCAARPAFAGVAARVLAQGLRPAPATSKSSAASPANATPGTTPAAAAGEGAGDGAGPGHQDAMLGCMPVRQQLLHVRQSYSTGEFVYEAVLQLAKHVPTAVAGIIQAISDSRPHSSASVAAHVAFAGHALRLARRMPVLHDRAMVLIAEQVLDLDMQVTPADIAAAAERRKTMDPGAPLPAASPEPDRANSAADLECSLAPDSIGAIDMNVAKLDQVLTLMLRHLARELGASQLLPSQTPAASTVDVGQARGLAMHLLLQRVFETSILQSHRSKCAQFLLFYTASHVPGAAPAFIQRLLSILENDREALITRQSAAAYLGSFVARAKAVQLGVVITALLRLHQACTAHLQRVDAALADDHPGAADPVKHGVFYSALQSSMYIVCFRARELLAAGKQKALAFFGWEHLLVSVLQPFKHCHHNVCSEFLRVMRLLNVLPGHTWRKLREAEQAGLGTARAAAEPDYPGPAVLTTPGHGVWHRLPESGEDSAEDSDSEAEAQEAPVHGKQQSFFPFDPLLLPNASKLIAELYNTWADCQLSGDHPALLSAPASMPRYATPSHPHAGLAWSASTSAVALGLSNAKTPGTGRKRRREAAAVEPGSAPRPTPRRMRLDDIPATTEL